jgi:hypothetical protein
MRTGQISRLNRWEGSIKDKTKNNLKFGNLIEFLTFYLLQEITNYFVVHSWLCMHVIAIHEIIKL